MPFFKADFTTSLAAKDNAGGGFLNLSKLADGATTRFHILSDAPITGFEAWIEKAEGGMAPRRSANQPDPELIAEWEAELGGQLAMRDGRPALKKFAAMFVWDYDAEEVKVFAPTQTTVLRDLARLTEDPDYSDLSSWDVSILRTGEKLNTKYAVDMKPTRATGSLAARITAAWTEAQDKGADLGALFTGGNPFAS